MDLIESNGGIFHVHKLPFGNIARCNNCKILIDTGSGYQEWSDIKDLTPDEQTDILHEHLKNSDFNYARSMAKIDVKDRVLLHDLFENIHENIYSTMNENGNIVSLKEIQQNLKLYISNYV